MVELIDLKRGDFSKNTAAASFLRLLVVFDPQLLSTLIARSRVFVLPLDLVEIVVGNCRITHLVSIRAVLDEIF